VENILIRGKYSLENRRYVVTVNAAEYGIDRDNRRDATEGLQKAIDDCAAVGGGVVYLPEGRYKLLGQVVIKTAVTLLGDWVNPDVEPNKGRGTILCCYYNGSGDEPQNHDGSNGEPQNHNEGGSEPQNYGGSGGEPQIIMNACSGLVGVTCYYPELDIHRCVAFWKLRPYPVAIRQDGKDSCNVHHVTLVNPYIGIQCGPDSNELHYLKDVYISPLSIGFYMDMTTDIGRMERLRISPKYYEEFTLYEGDVPKTQEERSEIRNYMLRESIGVFMARSDWEYGYDIFIEGCKAGVVITSMAHTGPNAQLSKVKIYNCDIGIHIIHSNPFGIALTDGVIYTDKRGLTAAIQSEDTFTTVVQCAGIKLYGDYRNLVLHKGSGQLNFVGSEFDGSEFDGSEFDGGGFDGSGFDGSGFDGGEYSHGSTRGAIIEQANGGLSIINCDIKGKNARINLQDGILGAQIVGCNTDEDRQGGTVDAQIMDCDDNEGRFKIITTEKSRLNMLYDEKRANISPVPRVNHPVYEYGTEASADILYTVREYGAVGDGVADDTDAFVHALKAAAKTGGIVYARTGWYKITRGLTIAKGVELRGVFETPCHTMGGGSVIQAYYGKGNEDGEPLLTLEGGCGVRGIVIHHPEQDPVEPHRYPWAIQGRGERCYVIDTVFVNAWLGIDMGSHPCPDYYISYVSGAPIRCGIYSGNNDGEGWIENVQYNPHYWYRSELPNHPSRGTWKQFWHNQIRYLDALKFGYNKNMHLLNTFVFSAKNGLYFYEEDGKGTNGLFIGHGTDGGEKGMRVDGIGEAVFVNTELVTIESTNQKTYVDIADTGHGSVLMYNTLMWGNPDLAVVVRGGISQMVQTNFVNHGKCAVTVKGGELTLCGSYFYSKEDQINITAGKLRADVNMVSRKGTGERGAEQKKDIEQRDSILSVVNNGGEITEWNNWSK